MAEQNLMVLTRRVESKIRVMRGRKVIFDSDLAELYGVAVKRLNQQVKRNTERFPTDFVFRVKEGDLRLQIATSKAGSGRGLEKGSATRGGRRYLPFAFTEHGGHCVELEKSGGDEHFCRSRVCSHARSAGYKSEDRG
jgi:hypothetical protein